MTIVEKIKNSIESAMGMGWKTYYHDDATLNVMTSKMEFPCAVLRLLTTGRMDLSGRERVTAAVFFIEPSQFDLDADNNEQIIQRCKERARVWLAGINADRYIRLLELSRTQRIYDTYDDIVTGFGLMLEIEELAVPCAVPPCPSDFNLDFSDDFGGDCASIGDFSNDFNNDFD